MKPTYIELWTPGEGRTQRSQHKNRTIHGAAIAIADNLAQARDLADMFLQPPTYHHRRTLRPILDRETFLIDNPLAGIPTLRYPKH